MQLKNLIFFAICLVFAKSESLVQDIDKVAKEEAFNKFDAHVFYFYASSQLCFGLFIGRSKFQKGLSCK